jgi:hypothetical protein
MTAPGNGGVSTTATRSKGKGNGFNDIGSAWKFLDDMNYLKDTDEPTDTNIAYILRHVAVQNGKIPLTKAHARVLIATAMLMEEVVYQKTGEIILGKIEEQILRLTTVPVTEKLTKISNWAVEETKNLEDKGKEIIERIDKARTQLLKMVTEQIAQALLSSQTSGPPNTYVQAVGRYPRTQLTQIEPCPAILDRQHIADRQILIDFTRDSSQTPPKALSPVEWVTKGNLAIEAVFRSKKQDTSQSGSTWVHPKVVAVLTLGNGGIILEFDYKEVAVRARNKQRSLAEHLGAGWTVKEKGWSIKVKFVPISTDLDRLGLYQCMYLQ